MPEPDNANWREEYKAYTSSEYELELLTKGATSLSSSWLLGAMYQKWKRIKGIAPDAPAPDCSSSFKEWNSRIK